MTACAALLAAFVVGCGQDTFGTASDAATSDDMFGSGDALDDGGVDATAVVDCGNPLTNPEHCGACGHRCLGGDCDSGTCMPVTLATNQAPYLIAVDNEGIYWTSQDADGGVTRANKDGGAQLQLSKHKAAEAIAVHQGYVYYSIASFLGKVLTDGGSSSVVSASVTTRDLAVDSNVFGTSVGTAATGVTEYDFALTATMTSPNQFVVPSGIALDANQVYFGVPGELRSVWRSDLSNGPKLTMMNPEGVAADALYVFWTNGDGTVRRAAPALTGSAALAVTQNNPHRLALDAKYVYWANGGGTIMRVDKLGVAAAAFLFTGPPGPRGIAVDAEAVYWTNEVNGTVMKVAKPLE